jgi:hypothetical protein
MKFTVSIRMLGKGTLLGMFALLALAGCASHRESIQKLPSIPITYELSSLQIERAIMDGCKRRNWIPSKKPDGSIEATLFIRNHVAVVRITYTRDSYTIRYDRSENLDYVHRANGSDEIHSKYNEWVLNLVRYINRSLEQANRERGNGRRSPTGRDDAVLYKFGNSPTVGLRRTDQTVTPA